MIERKNKTGKKGPPDSIRQAVPFNTVRRIRLKAGHFIHQPISTITFDLLPAGCTPAGLERRGLVEEDLTGYVAAFLDGIWLKAPYLHNGSVPTLRDLLEPAAQRPKVFWRGYDVYDQTKVGFVSDTPAAQRVGTKLDTASKGGGNHGHEFGTTLPAAEKDALVEYLKTL